MINKKITILGSGPVGVISACYLLEKGYSVTIIDNSEVKKSSIDSQKFAFKKNLNQIFSNFYKTSLKNKITLPISSHSIGGFTEVWGGTIDLFNKKEQLDWGFNNDDFIEKILYIFKKLELDIAPNVLNPSKLTNTNHDMYDEIFLELVKNLNKNKEKLIKDDLFHKLSLIAIKDGKIWSSSSLLSSLKTQYQKQINHLTDFEVRHINEINDEICLISQNNKKIIIKNSKLLIATGAFSTSILMCKLMKLKSFKLLDSKLQIMPLIWIGKRPAYNSDKSYPQLFFELLRKRKGELSIRSQLYCINKPLLESLDNELSFVRRLMIILSSILRDRLFINFIYSHSNDSTHYIFNIQNDDFKVKQIVRKNNDDFLFTFKKFAKSILRTKLIPIPIKKNFNTYGSFHIGSFSGVNGENKQELRLNNLGQYSKKSNIHAIDSSVLKSIPSGPITFTAMANALKIVEEVTK